MRSYRVQSNEKIHHVTIESENKAGCVIKLRNETIECICDRPSEISTWTIKREGARIRARARSLGSNRVEVWISGLPFLFTIASVGIDTEPIRPTSEARDGEVRAIMSGRIISILVEPGAEVPEGTPLLILEAMKMQNEIVSHKSGRIISIKVQVGDTVRKDDVLVEIR